MIFEKQRAYVVKVSGEIVVVAERVGDLYYVNELNQEHANIADTEAK